LKATFRIRARLHPPRRAEKGQFCDCFVSGHDFSRADKPFIFVIPSPPWRVRDLLFWFFRSLFSHAGRFFLDGVILSEVAATTESKDLLFADNWSRGWSTASAVQLRADFEFGFSR